MKDKRSRFWESWPEPVPTPCHPAKWERTGLGSHWVLTPGMPNNWAGISIILQLFPKSVGYYHGTDRSASKIEKFNSVYTQIPFSYIVKKAKVRNKSLLVITFSHQDQNVPVIEKRAQRKQFRE